MDVRRKILLVDDSALVRAVVTHSLTKEGIDVTSIDDPSGLGAAMTTERPDLLLVDATFPGVDHDELAALVGPHASTCPVVLFSDRPPEVLDALGRKMGAAGSVVKEAADLWSRLKPFLRAP